jgi:hypothetical protein
MHLSYPKTIINLNNYLRGKDLNPNLPTGHKLIIAFRLLDVLITALFSAHLLY